MCSLGFEAMTLALLVRSTSCAAGKLQEHYVIMIIHSKVAMYSDIHLFESNIYSTNIPSQYRRYLISTSFICNTKA